MDVQLLGEGFRPGYRPGGWVLFDHLSRRTPCLGSYVFLPIHRPGFPAMPRRRKTVPELVSLGTYRPGRHAGRGKNPKGSGAPTAPAWLTGAALSHWNETVPDLVAMGIAKAVDAPALAGLCRWFAVWREADSRLQAGDGDTYKTTVEAATAWKNYTAAAAKFGCTPGDRERLTVSEQETNTAPDDILEELLA